MHLCLPFLPFTALCANSDLHDSTLELMQYLNPETLIQHHNVICISRILPENVPCDLSRESQNYHIGTLIDIIPFYFVGKLTQDYAITQSSILNGTEFDKE